MSFTTIIVMTLLLGLFVGAGLIGYKLINTLKQTEVVDDDKHLFI